MVNKFDLLDKKHHEKARKYLENELRIHTGNAKSIPVYFASAKTGQGLERLRDEILKVYQGWNMRISTGALNDWIHKLQKSFQSDYKSSRKDSIYGKILYAT